MARVFIDTRSCFGWREATYMAGALDLEVVALVAHEGPNLNVVAHIKEEISNMRSASKVTTIEISCHTEQAVDIARELARPYDVIITDSCLLAFEFLEKSGAAVNNKGYEYTKAEIVKQINKHYYLQELKRQGKNPYAAWPRGGYDRERLLQVLERTLAGACDTHQQIVHEAWLIHKALYYREPRKGQKKRSKRTCQVCLTPDLNSQTKVYVDGDSCPVLPEIVELCGSAGVPVVFVCNTQQKNLIAKACSKTPDLPGRMQRLPKIEQITVPKRKDATDAFIRNRIRSCDIVLTNDTGLMAGCLNKDAIAIDYLGRVYIRRKRMCVSKRSIQRAREGQRPSAPVFDRDRFRRSLQKVLENYPGVGREVAAADSCKVVALEIARRQGRVTTRKLRESVDVGSWSCLRALRELTSMGVLEWHGSCAHDPRQFYSLAS